MEKIGCRNFDIQGQLFIIKLSRSTTSRHILTIYSKMKIAQQSKPQEMETPLNSERKITIIIFHKINQIENAYLFIINVFTIDNSFIFAFFFKLKKDCYLTTFGDLYSHALRIGNIGL